MKTITFKEFKNSIKGKEGFQELQINPYFNNEGFSAKVICISDQVEEMVSVKNRSKDVALVFPDNGSIKASLEPYFTQLQTYIRVLCPVMSVFDMNGKKLAQLNESRKEALV